MRGNMAMHFNFSSVEVLTGFTRVGRGRDGNRTLYNKLCPCPYPVRRYTTLGYVPST